MKQALAETMRDFSLPRYENLPNMGLYLEQAAKYINQCLEPLGCMEITGSMIRNYVKKGLVKNPVQKQYYAGHIAHLIAITVLKNVLPLEYVNMLFSRQKKVYTDTVAYNYLCMEFENVLYFRFGLKESAEDIGHTQSVEKEMLRSAITAVSHIVFLSACMKHLEKDEEK